MQKKMSAAICFVVFILALVVPAQKSYSAEKYKLTIATGGTGGTYYPSAGGVGELLRNKLDMVDAATAEVTGGSVVNAQLVNRGKADMGMMGWIGVEGAGIADKVPNIRSMFFIHGNTCHWAVGMDSDIRSLSDLKGKRVALDAPGSAGLVSSELVLKLYGLDLEKDLKVQRITQSQGADAFKDGRVDVVFGDVGYPNSTFMDLTTIKDVRILGFSDEDLKKIEHAYPSLPRETIPAGTYKNQKEDVHTYTEAGIWGCRADLPEELVYQMMKTIYENQDTLTENVHKAIGRWRFDPAVKNLVPLHPGAEKFYKELGLM